ncbi:MAG: hypothetical protein ACFE8B_14800 [Candidatus Hermodarchaeota archaeon]
MGEIKKLYLLLPLIGGVLSIIGILIPAWYSPPPWVEYIWIAGIIHHVTAGDVLDVLPIEMFIPSIIAVVIISLGSIIILIYTFFNIQGKKSLSNVENLWIIIAIIEIATAIYYILGIQFGFFLHSDQNFWSIYEIQFGMVTPFIGASLTLIGAILRKRIKRDIGKSFKT